MAAAKRAGQLGHLVAVAHEHRDVGPRRFRRTGRGIGPDMLGVQAWTRFGHPVDLVGDRVVQRRSYLAGRGAGTGDKRGAGGVRLVERACQRVGKPEHLGGTAAVDAQPVAGGVAAVGAREVGTATTTRSGSAYVVRKEMSASHVYSSDSP